MESFCTQSFNIWKVLAHGNSEGTKEKKFTQKYLIIWMTIHQGMPTNFKIKKKNPRPSIRCKYKVLVLAISSVSGRGKVII
jgi:hypothetical protein